jgi:hypothetical protein
MNTLFTIIIVVFVYSIVGGESQSALDSTGCWDGTSAAQETSTSGAVCQTSFCSTPDIEIQSDESCPPGASSGVTASVSGLSPELTGVCGVCPAGYFIANITQCSTGLASNLVVATCPVSGGSSLCSLCPNALISYPYDSNVSGICPSSSTPGVISGSCACAPGQQVAFQSQNMTRVCSELYLDPFSCWMFYGSTYDSIYPGAFYPICEQCPRNTYQSLGGLNPCLQCPTGCTSNQNFTGCVCQNGATECQLPGPFQARCDTESTPSNSIAFVFSVSS